MVFDLALIIPYLRLTILLIGFYVNFDFVYLTIITKSLHGACNFLLAMEALTNGVYSIFNIGTFLTKTFGIVFKYKTKKTMPYLFFHLFIAFGYSTFLFFNQYNWVMRDANTILTQCVIQEITPVDVLTYSLIMNGWAIFNYLLFLFTLGYKFMKRGTNLQLERITKCILAILTMILFGWNWAQLARFLRSLPFFPPIFFDIMACIVLLFLGTNPIVFYIFSEEYQIAFLKHYAWIYPFWDAIKKKCGIDINTERLNNPNQFNSSNNGTVPIRNLIMRQISVYPSNTY